MVGDRAGREGTWPNNTEHFQTPPFKFTPPITHFRHLNCPTRTVHAHPIGPCTEYDPRQPFGIRRSSVRGTQIRLSPDEQRPGCLQITRPRYKNGTQSLNIALSQSRTSHDSHKSSHRPAKTTPCPPRSSSRPASAQGHRAHLWQRPPGFRCPHGQKASRCMDSIEGEGPRG